MKLVFLSFQFVIRLERLQLSHRWKTILLQQYMKLITNDQSKPVTLVIKSYCDDTALFHFVLVWW